MNQDANNHHSRRSRKPIVNNTKHVDMLTTHSLEDDMPDIIKYAALFTTLDERSRAAASAYIFDNMSLDYYHGVYVATFQIYMMATASGDKVILPALTCLIHGICHKIVLVKDLVRPGTTKGPVSAAPKASNM